MALRVSRRVRFFRVWPGNTGNTPPNNSKISSPANAKAARWPKDTDLAAVGKYIYHSGNSFSGVAACASCHGKDASGTVSLPRLAGQHANYIENQLKSFGNRERTNDNAVMHAIVTKMTALETAAVAEYLSGK